MADFRFTRICPRACLQSLRTTWSDNNMNVEHMKAKIAKYDYYIDISSYRLIIDDDNHFHLKHLKTLRESQRM